MTGPTRRLLVAGMLTGAAVVVPCAAWYVVGSRDVAREAARLERVALETAQSTADVLAMRVATRLENLREAEAVCPPSHYRHLERAGGEDCDCPGVDPAATSPSAGSELVEARFEIDEGGRVGVGSVVEPEEAERVGALLFPVTPALLVSLDEPPYLSEVLEPERIDDARDRFRPELVEGRNSEGAEGLISLGPFRWRTAALEGEPTLLAVRRVVTTTGGFVQGFVVSASAIEASLAGAAQPVRLVHGPAGLPGESDVPVPGTAWRLVADPSEALDDAAARGAEVRKRFLGAFGVGATAALIAGLCLVGLVWQSERMSRLRARFAAAAAHELRTPLASIRLHGEMLAESLGKPDLAREYADRVADEAERLGRVVTNVLGYAKLEDGSLPVRPEAGDLEATVRETIESLRPGLEAAGARLELSVGDEIPAATFDPDAVRHVVQNLVDNAEKFSRAADDRTIDVRIEERGDVVLLAVSDHGPGVPAENHRSLFHPHARDSREGADAGLGLGLVLVQRLVRAMNGDVAYADTPGGGATFNVTFPADRTLLLDTPD